MPSRRITLEHALYALALAIALGLRFFHLGALPLSDPEAGWALQALAIVNGAHPALGPNPAYIHLTVPLFALFGTGHFWARFWPALAGTALALAPWFLRRRIGRLPALVLAFGLALDPGLNALSRQAGGPMLAIAFLVLTLVLWLDRRRAAAGLFAGLALLTGPSVWFGLLGLVIAWGLTELLPARFREDAAAAANADDTGPAAAPVRFRLEELKGPLAWGLGALLLVGSLFIFSPQGLAAFAASLPAFLRGWVTLSDIPLGRVLLALPAYELLPLGFGLAGLVRGALKKDAFSIRLGVWTLVAFLLVLLFPGRQAADLAWMLLPLWTLAALEIGSHFDFEGRSGWVVGGLAAFLFATLVFSWLQLAKATTVDPSLPQFRLLWLLVLGILLVIAIMLILVGTGWSFDEACLGGVWGALAPLVLFTLAMTTGATQVREPRTLELWDPEPRLGGRADLVLKVANQISNLNTGYDAQLPLTIAGVDSPALRWLFRDWNVQAVDSLAPGATPELVITPVHVDLSLTAAYRGEPLVWREKGDWHSATSSAWLNWFVYRQMTVQREDVILWVRADLMLDSQGLPAPNP